MEYVTIDLITNLLDSDGYMLIAVFEDKLTKMVYLAGCSKEVTAMEYAKLFVDHVFQLHGLPKVIISDWDLGFIGKFWKSLFDLLGMDLHFSTPFHLQTDCQYEWMIHTVQNFLRPYVEKHLAS